MVIKPTVLIIRDDHYRLVPLWARPDGLVDLLDKNLPLVDVVRGVVVVGGAELGVHVALLHDGVAREAAEGGVELEGEGVGAEFGEEFELAEAPEEEGGGDVLVVDAEGDAGLV